MNKEDISLCNHLCSFCPADRLSPHDLHSDVIKVLFLPSFPDERRGAWGVTQGLMAGGGGGGGGLQG